MLASNRPLFASADREMFGHRVTGVFVPLAVLVPPAERLSAMIAVELIAPESVELCSILALNSLKPLEFVAHSFRSPCAAHHSEPCLVDDPCFILDRYRLPPTC